MLVVLSALLVTSPSTVAAEDSHSCPQDLDGPSRWSNDIIALTSANQLPAGWDAGDSTTALAVADQLEDAWAEGDSTAGLALFADTAVATGPGSRWHGSQELGSFLDRMWDPTYAADVSRFETTGRCVMGGRVLWLFDYPDSGATGSADLLVQGGLITLISWTYTPDGAVKTVDSTAEPSSVVETTSRVARDELWAALVSVGTLVTIGLLRRQRASGDDRFSGQDRYLLSALRKATVDRGQERTP